MEQERQMAGLLEESHLAPRPEEPAVLVGVAGEGQTGRGEVPCGSPLWS
jgi:hypothetical protein